MNFIITEEKKLKQLAFELPSHEDPYGDNILKMSGDPSWEKLAAVLPQNNSWDFIATPQSRWKYLIGSDGRITIESTVATSNGLDYRHEICCLFDPAGMGFDYHDCSSQQSLLSGWLPVNCMTFTAHGRKVFSQTAFAVSNDIGKTEILIKITQSNLTQESFFVISEPNCSNREELLRFTPERPILLADGKRFERGLRALKTFWKHELSDMISFSLPEKRLKKAIKASLVKALNSQVDGSPYYGVTRYFCDTERNAESFPPTTITLVNTCTYWGLFKHARHFIINYLNNFVSSSGELIHRGNGASLSEHGMLLDCIANYILSAGDFNLLEEVGGAIKGIANFLLSARLSSSSGLIKACAEDDTRGWTQAHWFSGNMWTCRGMFQLAEVLRKSDPKWHSFADCLKKEATIFRQDLQKIIDDSIVYQSIPPFIPPLPEMKTPFNSMTSDLFWEELQRKKHLLFSAYCNYRFFPEMLSAGIMTEFQANILLKFRKARGGEFCGLTRFASPVLPEVIDDWPLYNQLWALINYDKPREFLLALYAHMTHHQARDTFFAPESTPYDRLDSIHCVPSQLIIPLGVRWMLVFAEYDRPVLHLNRATPCHWLKRVKNKILLKNAPTRFGKISYEIKKIAEREWQISLDTNFTSIPDEIIIHLRSLNLPGDVIITGDGAFKVSQTVISITPKAKNYTFKIS
jgi:hypothetical protein